MEAKKRRDYYENIETSFVDGNTVRKLRVAPDIRREEERYVTPSPRRQERIQPRVFSGINFGSLVILTVAIIATVYVCVDYLMLQTQVSQMEKGIIKLEKELSALRDENDAAYEAIDTALDLGYIYQVAVEELGMVYPNKNEVITFQNSSANYVRQYEDIPK